MREDVDADAVARVRKGDHSAFAELYDRYAKLVRCISYDEIANFSDSHDICQNVFLKAFKCIHVLRDPRRFAHWLTGITRNAIKDWQRSHARDRLRFDESIPDTELLVEDTSNVVELRDAIRTLPEKERMALHLFYLDEEPTAVAMQILGLSQSAFYKLLEKARRQVADKMKATQEKSDG